jgi:hypothetical protein
MTIDEDPLTELLDAGMLTAVEEFCGGGTITAVDESCRAVVGSTECSLTERTGAGMMIDVEELGVSGTNTESCWTKVGVTSGTVTEVVGLGRGTARVDDARRRAVDAFSESSAPKSRLAFSVPSPATSFRSKKSPMAFAGGLEDLCRRANSGSVKLETTLAVSSTQIKQRTATRYDAGGAIAATVSGLAGLNTLVRCQHSTQRTDLVNNYELNPFMLHQKSYKKTGRETQSREGPETRLI